MLTRLEFGTTPPRIETNDGDVVTDSDHDRERELADLVRDVEVLRSQIDPMHPDESTVQAYAAAVSRLLMANPGPDILKSLGSFGVSVGLVVPDWDGEEARPLRRALETGDREKLKSELLAQEFPEGEVARLMDFMNPDDLTPEILDRLREFVPQFEVNAGQLRRVIPIGQAVEVSGTRVELIAMEIRDAGAIVYWKAFTDQERLIGPIQAEVSDDRGTDNKASSMEYGGSDNMWKGELVVTPAPPPDVRTVRVAVRGFAPFGETPFPSRLRTSIEGDWQFEFGTDDGV
jgi:hypothetical protein